MKQSIVYVVVGILSGGSRISREEGWALTYYYRLQTKLREDNVFTPVCYSVHRGGGLPLGRGGGYLPLVLRGYPHPTGRHCLGRHLPGQTPPDQTHTPQADTPCLGRHPTAWAGRPPPLEMTIEAGCTHTIGMHSCYHPQ